MPSIYTHNSNFGSSPEMHKETTLKKKAFKFKSAMALTFLCAELHNFLFKSPIIMKITAKISFPCTDTVL